MKRLSVVILLLLAFASIASSQPANFILQSAASVGNGTSINVTGLSTLTLGILGTAGADETVTFNGSENSVNFATITCRNLSSLATGTSTIVSGTTLQQWSCPVAGLKLFRAVLSGGVPTGTVTITAVGLPNVSWIPPSSSSSVLDSGGQVYNVKASPFNAVCDGVTDDSTAVLLAISTATAANGGVIYFPAGSCVINSAVLLPASGSKSLRFTGAGRKGVAGGTTLLLGYAGAVAKIDTRFSGHLEIDHITLQETTTGTTTPFIQTTNTILHIHDTDFVGHSSKTGVLCDQDGIILGGDTITVDSSEHSPFKGYGTVIEVNGFHSIRRAVWFRAYANGVQVVNNNIFTTAGSNSNTAGAIDLSGVATGAISGNYIAGNLIETAAYPRVIYVDYASENNFIGNNLFDGSQVVTLANYYFTANALRNLVIPGIYSRGVIAPMVDLNGMNCFLSAASDSICTNGLRWTFSLLTGNSTTANQLTVNNTATGFTSLGAGGNRVNWLTVLPPVDIANIGGTTTVNASTTITGSGTTFTTKFAIGDRVSLSSAPSTYAYVTTVTSDTSMTVNTALGNGTSQTINKKSSIARFALSNGGAGVLIDDQGRIGVGTDKPAGALEIATGVTGLVMSNNTVIYWRDSTTALNAFMRLNSSNDFTFQNDVANKDFVFTAGSELFRIKSAQGSMVVGGSDDLGFKRESTGILQINSGTSGTLRDLNLRHLNVGSVMAFSTATPTISSGFGGTPSVTGTRTAAFSVNVGTGGAASTGVIAMNATALNGWACNVDDITTPATNSTRQTGSSTTTVSVTNYTRTTGIAGAWPASDILSLACIAY